MLLYTSEAIRLRFSIKYRLKDLTVLIWTNQQVEYIIEIGKSGKFMAEISKTEVT
jgi:hypothetical protein